MLHNAKYCLKVPGCATYNKCVHYVPGRTPYNKYVRGMWGAVQLSEGYSMSEWVKHESLCKSLHLTEKLSLHPPQVLKDGGDFLFGKNRDSGVTLNLGGIESWLKEVKSASFIASLFCLRGASQWEDEGLNEWYLPLKSYIMSFFGGLHYITQQIALMTHSQQFALMAHEVWQSNPAPKLWVQFAVLFCFAAIKCTAHSTPVL